MEVFAIPTTKTELFIEGLSALLQEGDELVFNLSNAAGEAMLFRGSFVDLGGHSPESNTLAGVMQVCLTSLTIIVVANQSYFQAFRVGAHPSDLP